MITNDDSCTETIEAVRAFFVGSARLLRYRDAILKTELLTTTLPESEIEKLGPLKTVEIRKAASQ